MKKLLLLFALTFSFAASSQSLDDYKYASVPARFSIFKNDNYNRINVLTKMYMQKYGFETYLTSETQPTDFANSNCNKVFVDLIENNNMFVTKVKVVIKDCKGNVLGTSGEGSSREKDLQIAYNEAIRKAFASFPVLVNHKYTPKTAEPVQEKTVASEEIKRQEVIQEIPVIAEPKQLNTSILYAQPIANGYQLIDSEPKVVLKIYKTSDTKVYTALKGTTQGVLIFKNGGWFFEYYQNDKLISEKIDVKF